MLFDAPDALQGVGRAADDDRRPAGAAADEQPAGPRVRRGLRRAARADSRRRRRAAVERAYRIALRPRADRRRSRPTRWRSSSSRRDRTRPGKPTPPTLALADFCQVAVVSERVRLRRVIRRARASPTARLDSHSTLADMAAMPTVRHAATAFARAGSSWRRARQRLRPARAGGPARPATRRSRPTGAEPARARSRRTSRPRRRRVIWLFMNGGPSQVDTWDYKPELEKRDGQELTGFDKNTGFFTDQVGPLMKSPFKFAQHGQCGHVGVGDLPEHGRARRQDGVHPLVLHRVEQPLAGPVQDQHRHEPAWASRASARG